MNRTRGFTLIELVVSLAMGAVVLTVATAVLATAMRDMRVARARSALAREGQTIAAMMELDLRQAGAGVPDLTHIDPGFPGGGAALNAVLAGESEKIGVLLDRPRPHAQYNTFGTLNRAPGGSTSRIAWHTENNGTCMPDGTCSTAATSVFFPGESGCTASFTDRTCPWGMRRAESGDAIQIVDGEGRWSHAVLGNSIATNGSNRFAVLSTAWSGTLWPNVTAADKPVSAAGQGWVTTLDRVFFRKNGTKLERIQCWGTPNQTSASWPIPGTAVPATPCAPPNGLDWETLSNRVQSLTFTYFNAAGTAITAAPMAAVDLPRVRRVDYVLKLAQTVEGRAIRFDIVGSVHLRNL